MPGLAILFMLGFGTVNGNGLTAPEDEMENTGSSNQAKATFAGGCFWCMQPPFDGLPGVLSTRAGYTGGSVPDPSYEQVCEGTTGHAEAVEIIFDPARISYEALLDIFWKNVDPTAYHRQFADEGSQYRTAIFYHGDAQKNQALLSRETIQHSGRFTMPIVTEIVPAQTFYPAEDYHQSFYKKNPARYKTYRKGSGREDYLKEKWGS